MNLSDKSLDDLLEHLRARFNNDLPHFTDCIKSAFASVDAVFWRKQYLAFYWRCVTTVPGYIEEVVVANALAESAGSKGLYELWQSVLNAPEVARGIEAHYRDEARHSRLFVHLCQLAFPKYLSENELERKRQSLFDATTA